MIKCTAFLCAVYGPSTCKRKWDAHSHVMNMVSAPSIPADDVSRLCGLKPGPGGGSCGNAVHGNAPVFVYNTFTDPHWSDLRNLARDFNLCSCWSFPVRNEQGEAIGSFALSSFEHRTPSDFHKRLLDVGAALIAIVLLRHAQQQQLQQQREQLIYSLEHDALTGLPNSQSLLRALKAAPGSAALVLINLNNLGYINTAYGLGVGDKLLRTLAVELNRVVLSGCVYRGSADEFAVLYDQLNDPVKEVERLRQHFFAEPVQLDGLNFYLTFNAGVACGGEDLLRRAMVALKQANQKGKSATHLFDPDQEMSARRKKEDYLGWNARLHEAMHNHGIKAWFQGIRDNHSGHIQKWEALVRLEHNGEVYSPGHFLEVAALSGLLPSITRSVVEQGIALLARVEGELAVNITETDIELGYLPDYLDQLTRRYGVARERIILEILEGTSSAGKQTHLPQLQLLKQRGYRLAIDDFGTEYSNFERILELEVDIIKIDAKYIRNIHLDPTSYEIVRAIVYFARNAGIRTVAEFVHCEEVQAVVMELGIDESQGYLFSEPGPLSSPL
ncbi:diguanylate cyclase (GGDEF)-like protein [Marinobacterium sp. MBR-111]